MLLSVLASASATAHAELVRSSPPADALLAVPPRQIDLWMSESVASGAGSPIVRVLDEAGRDLKTGQATVAADDPTHLTASVSGVGSGTFTVVWTSRSADDGHVLTGSFAFRAGGTARAPGAATVEGETPSPWAVVTRWLTFLGASIAAAGFAFALLFAVQSSGDVGGERRRNGLIASAAGVALVATIAEPLLQSLFPPSGALKPSVGDALAALPDAWWLRAPFMMVALVLAMALGRVRPLRRHGRPTAAIGCGAALAAMLGLSLTSHAASRDSWRALTTGSVILHEWSVGLWVGGLVCLALLRPGRSGGAETGGGRDPVRVFSTYALPLVAVGVLTGAVNAGFILPSLHALWQSDYGRVLIAKVAILVPALALATFHRARLRDLTSTAAATLRASMRIETAVVAAVVLGGTVLSLLAPPATAKTGSAASVDLAAPLVGDAPNEDLYARLTVAPAKPGDNTVSVLVTEGQPLAFGATGGLVPRPTLTTIALARVTFTSLDQDAAPVSTELTRGADGVFTGSGGALSMTGWYRADVLVRRDGVQDAGVDFYMLLPDPNVSGFDAGPRPASDPAARALFDRGRLALTALHSVAFVERLGGGTGTVVTSAQRVSDGTDGRSPSLSIFTPDTEMIRIGSAQWVHSPGDPWNKSASGPVVPPSDWGSDYDAATAFHLGRIDDVNGIAAQIVTIFVPGTSLAPAWYAWWIEPATGHLLRETMVSRGHYMEREFSDFDQPQPISPPDQSATPAPAATPR